VPRRALLPAIDLALQPKQLQIFQMLRARGYKALTWWVVVGRAAALQSRRERNPPGRALRKAVSQTGTGTREWLVDIENQAATPKTLFTKWTWPAMSPFFNRRIC
jgi:hypothetical protein